MVSMTEGLISAAPKENVGTFTQQTTRENDERPKSQQVVHKSLMSSDALYQYLLTTSVYPREHPMLKKLREVTLSHPWNIAATAPDEGQFLQFLLKTTKAKNTLELGVYTGYSLLTTALSLPDDGKIIAVDLSRDCYEIGRPIIEEAGVAHKIEFHESSCMDAIQELVAQEKYHGFFDFIFVDADKNNYVNYHPILLKLVKVQGIIGYDNTLLQGAVIAKMDDQITDFARFFVDFVKEFNIYLAADSRVEICHLSVSDGITLCRRIV